MGTATDVHAKITLTEVSVAFKSPPHFFIKSRSYSSASRWKFRGGSRREMARIKLQQGVSITSFFFFFFFFLVLAIARSCGRDVQIPYDTRGKCSYALVDGLSVGLASGVEGGVTCFGPVVSSALYPLKPPFSRTSSSFRAGCLSGTPPMS